MTAIYHLHYKPPGHDLGIVDAYYSYDVCFHRTCSIERNGDGSFTLHATDLVLATYGNFINQALIPAKNIKTAKTVLTNGLQIAHWLQERGDLINEDRIKGFSRRLAAFDRGLADCFMHAIRGAGKEI